MNTSATGPGLPARNDVLDCAVGASFPLLLGGVLLRLVTSGAYASYVKGSMRPWLLVAAMALVAMGGWLLLGRRRGPSPVPAVGWMLLAPVFAVLVVAPGALGAGALDRARPAPRGATNAWDALSPSDGPHAMTLGEFVDRSQAGDTVRGVPARFVGFVAPADGGGAFRVARYRISCCAADAQALAVVVVADGAPTKPADDRWVEVVGELVPDDPPTLEPRFHVTSMTDVAAPAQPYESMLAR